MWSETADIFNPYDVPTPAEGQNVPEEEKRNA